MPPRGGQRGLYVDVADLIAEHREHHQRRVEGLAEVEAADVADLEPRRTAALPHLEREPSRQVESLAGQALGDRVTLTLKQPAVAEDGLLVHAEKEWSRIDTPRFQPPRQLSGVKPRFLTNHQPEHPVHTSSPGLLDLQLDARHLGQTLGIRLAHAPLAGDDLVHAVDLRQSQRSLKT